MGSLWFTILACMLTTYAVLDGFDFGAGIIHFFVAKTEEERRTVFAAIGPLWDGNEVWLIAAGGVFFFAFPRAYAAAFSGLYLPLTIVVWLIILRGLSIELRSQLAHPLWRRAFDVVFAGASATMAVVLGVALGNVVRGVPIDASGYFHEDLFGGGGKGVVGAIDVYTLPMGLFALAALGAHGATFLAWKADGPLAARCVRIATLGYRGLLGLAVVISALTFVCVPTFFPRVVSRPWIWPLPLLGMAAGAYVPRALRLGRSLTAFLASCAFLAALLLSTAAVLYPTILRSTVSDEFTLDVSSASGAHALAAGLGFWVVAAALVIGYFIYVFLSFRGKVKPDEGHG